MKSKTVSLTLLLLSIFFFPSDSLQNNGIMEEHPYWLKIKTLFTHAQSYFFPPNLDFRGTASSSSNDESRMEGGSGDKVKEAVAKSLGEGKATVEESAKSAAQKLKDTFSSHHQPHEL